MAGLHRRKWENKTKLNSKDEDFCFLKDRIDILFLVLPVRTDKNCRPSIYSKCKTTERWNKEGELASFLKAEMT